MQKFVLRSDTAGVATLRLNRPEKLNALSVPVFRELRQHIEDIAAHPAEVKVVVLRGAGKCFSAGHDLGDLVAGEHAPQPHFQAQTIEALANLAQPVIAAVHGHCYTGALELALAADILLCAASARFADTHAKWALMPVWGLSQRLPRRVGMARAREMMLTCSTYTGEEAKTMGLVNVCVPDDQFDAEIMRWCATIQQNSSFTHQSIKQLLSDTDGMALSAGLAYEIYRSPGVGPDMHERIAAFMNRTKQ
ncbi:MAG: enoyl-CoA hydratase/isomerase family protein [Steroidobacteraceae bacterium]